MTTASTATAHASKGCSPASSAGRKIGRSERRPLALDLQGQHHSPSTARRRTRASPIPLDPSRIFSWLICETRDDKGNAILYDYKPEDGAGVDLDPGPRAQPGRPRRSAPHGQPLSEAHPLRQPHAPAGQRGQPAALPDRRADRRTPAGCSRSSSTTASTTPTRPTPDDAGDMDLPRTIRSPPTAPASRCAPTASASAC